VGGGRARCRTHRTAVRCCAALTLRLFGQTLQPAAARELLLAKIYHCNDAAAAAASLSADAWDSAALLADAARAEAVVAGATKESLPDGGDPETAAALWPAMRWSNEAAARLWLDAAAQGQARAVQGLGLLARRGRPGPYTDFWDEDWDELLVMLML
jgi:hypothetical protein